MGKNVMRNLLPIMLAFFVMGFVDIVGVSTSFVKSDFKLSDTLANMLPSMVFVWFAVCSLPTGIFMGRAGRRKTSVYSLALTSVAMILPLCCYSLPTILVAFMLLGISNTMLQVALNPLVLDVVPAGKVTSVLTFGMFIKAVSSTLGPVFVSLVVGFLGYWYLAFVVYAAFSFIACLWLALTNIKESKEAGAQVQHFSAILALFKNGKLLTSFAIIALCVGFEISLMVAVPKYYNERWDIPLDKGSLGCSIYFAARTIGTLVGSIALARCSASKFLIGNLVAAIIVFLAFIFTPMVEASFVGLFAIGFTCANIFPIVYSSAIQSIPGKANEISAMMIVGVAGGALLPIIMGVFTDNMSQWAGLFIPLAAVVTILIAFYAQNRK